MTQFTWHRNGLTICSIIFFTTFPHLLLGYGNQQIPPAIIGEIDVLAIQFNMILQAECEAKKCFSLGCKPLKFIPLKKADKPTLPGFAKEKLKYDPNADEPTYQLLSAQCQFAYEPELAAEYIESVQARTLLKLSHPNMEIDISGQKLVAKAKRSNLANKEPVLGPEKPQPLTQEKVLRDFWITMLPHLPWIIATVLFSLLAFLFVFFLLKGWHKNPTSRGLHGSSPDPGSDDNNNPRLPQRDVPPELIFEKSDRIRNLLVTNYELAKSILQPLLDEKNIEELCLILRFFGPACFAPIRGEQRNFEILETLAKYYPEYEEKFDPYKGLAFLNKMEQRIAGIQIRMKTRPIAEEFRFLENITEDEFVALLKGLNENQVIAVVSHCPEWLIAKFVSLIGTNAAKIWVDKLIHYDSLSESFVRETARMVGQNYHQSAGKYRNILLDKANIIEGVINQLPAPERKNALSGLLTANSEQATQLTKEIVLDDTLLHLPKAILDGLFLHVDQKYSVTYLNQLPEETAKPLLDLLSPKIRETLSQKLNSIEIQTEQINPGEARKKVTDYIKNQHRLGLIDLGTINQKVL